MFTKHQEAETKKYLSFVTYVYEILSVKEQNRLKTLVHLDTNKIENKSISYLLFNIIVRLQGTRWYAIINA